MINTSRRNLKIISFIIIVVGGLILFYKGYLLLREANYIRNDIEIISLVMGSAFIIGLLKNRFIMSKFNKQNIARINELKDPKIYQFFESRFFILLVLMLVVGISLSNYASGDYTMLLIVGGIDLALSTALLKSSTIFFMDKSMNL